MPVNDAALLGHWPIAKPEEIPPSPGYLITRRTSAAKPLRDRELWGG